MEFLFDRRWRRFVIGALAVICLSASAVIFWRVSGPTSMRPVTVHIQNLKGSGVAFTVPSAYLEYFPREKATSMWMLAVYPDMSPYRLLSRDQREYPDAGQYAMDIQVNATNTLQTVHALFDGNVNAETLAANGEMTGFQVYRNKQYGEIYEFLVPVESGEYPRNLERVIDCGPYLNDELTKHFRGICWAYVQPSDGFYIRYGVARDHLPRWQDVERKVLGLLQKFDMRCYRGELQDDEEPAETFPCELRSHIQ